MGPFPHDAPPATISADNPMGTDGFEFVEYAHPDPQALHALFKLMGYAPVARDRLITHQLEQRMQFFGPGMGVFDELKSVGTHRIVGADGGGRRVVRKRAHGYPPGS